MKIKPETYAIYSGRKKITGSFANYGSAKFALNNWYKKKKKKRPESKYGIGTSDKHFWD